MSKNTRKVEKKIVNFRFDKNTIELVDELKQDLGLSSNADVLKKSLALLKVVRDAQTNNEKLYIKGEESEREIILC